MTWFHLSPDDCLNSIVPSTAEKTSSSITPRIPNDSYAEDQTTYRVCIAPTVWQCVLSIPRKGLLYIYAFDIESVTEPTGWIADIEITHEKWITDVDIRRSNGSIALSQLGSINITRQLKLSLKTKNKQQRLPFAPADQSPVWDIRGDEWTLNQQFRVG